MAAKLLGTDLVVHGAGNHLQYQRVDLGVVLNQMRDLFECCRR